MAEPYHLARYHFSTKTNKLEQCTAKKRECNYARHWRSEAEANASMRLANALYSEDNNTYSVAELSKLLPKSRSVRRGLNNPEHPETLDQLTAEHEQQWAKLNDEEISEVEGYTFMNYEFTNAFLRGITPHNTLIMRQEDEKGLRDYYKDDPVALKNALTELDRDYERTNMRSAESVANIDSAFSKLPKQIKPRVVYRVHRVRGTETQDDLNDYISNNYKVGQIITEKAYTSTSLDSDFILAYIKNRPEQEMIIYEIVAKQPGLVLHQQRGKSASQIPAHYEREILLNRNSKFQIVNVTEGTYETTYPDGVPDHPNFSYSRPIWKKRLKIIQMVEVD